MTAAGVNLRPRPVCRRLLHGVLVAVLWLAVPGAGAESPQAAAVRILAEIPKGTTQERGWWVYERARAERDGKLALELMRAVADRFGKEPGERARLWIVRYFAAANDLPAARAALPPEIRPETSAQTAAQWRYWRVLLEDPAGKDPAADLQADPGADSGADVAAPSNGPASVPWEVLADLAGIGASLRDNQEARLALGLEGAARRTGLMGPYLWRLLHAGHPWLTSAAQAMLETADQPLEAAPDLPLLVERVAAGRSTDVSLGRADGPPEAVVAESGKAGIGARPRFAVQVGAFLQESSARSLVRELGTHGFQAYVSPLAAPEGPALQRVRLGPCRTLAEAESLGTALARRLMLPYQIVDGEEQLGQRSGPREGEPGAQQRGTR